MEMVIGFANVPFSAASFLLHLEGGISFRKLGEEPFLSPPQNTQSLCLSFLL